MVKLSHLLNLFSFNRGFIASRKLSSPTSECQYKIYMISLRIEDNDFQRESDWGLGDIFVIRLYTHSALHFPENGPERLDVILFSTYAYT